MSDGLWFTKNSSGFVGWFRVEQTNGTLRTGALATSFIVTVVNPADSASSVPSVSQSTTKAGLYKFTIPSAFLITHGAGTYGVVVEVNISTPPKVTSTFSAILKVSLKDLDDLSTQASVNSLQTSITSLAAAIIAADLVVAAGSTSTVVKTNATQATGFYDGLIIVAINAAGTVARSVTSYSNTDGAFTLDSALPFTPSVSDRFIVLGRIASAAAAVDNSAVATAVWAKSILSPTVGSYGELVNQIGDLTSLIPAAL